VEGTWQLIKQAYVSRAWSALGYVTWDDYCVREFGSSRIALPREDRQEAVMSLREAGLSLRAIASVTGVHNKTIERDLAASPRNAALPDRTQTTDGRTYPARQPRPDPEPKWSDDELALQEQAMAGHTVVASMRGEIHQNLIKWAAGLDRYTRIDRKSPWGNPFELPTDGTREQVIKKYDRYYLPHKPGLIKDLPRLKGRVLGCWCAPLACHGDVLKREVERGQ